MRRPASGGFDGGADRFGGDYNRTVNVYHDNYWHAPVYHGAWYAGAPVAAGAAVGAAAATGVAARRAYYDNYYDNPYDRCGYYPYPPCY